MGISFQYAICYFSILKFTRQKAHTQTHPTIVCLLLPFLWRDKIKEEMCVRVYGNVWPTSTFLRGKKHYFLQLVAFYISRKFSLVSVFHTCKKKNNCLGLGFHCFDIARSRWLLKCRKSANYSKRKYLIRILI